jgi:hypothetical protein
MQLLGKERLYGFHEFVDEGLVSLTANALLS